MSCLKDLDKIKMLYIIQSAPVLIQRRTDIRKSWLNWLDKEMQEDTKILFLMGYETMEEEIIKTFREEMSIYCDILMMDFIGIKIQKISAHTFNYTFPF